MAGEHDGNGGYMSLDKDEGGGSAWLGGDRLNRLGRGQGN